MSSTLIPFTSLLPSGLGNPTLWGLSAPELHDRYWAAQGVQVVRPGGEEDLTSSGLYLLIDPPTLMLFDLPRILARALTSPLGTWLLRLEDSRCGQYREVVRTDEQHRFVRVERLYDQTEIQCARAALTRDRALARLWHHAGPTHAAWRQVRRLAKKGSYAALSLHVPLYHREHPDELLRLILDLTYVWRNPSDTLPGVRRVAPGIWCDQQSRIEPGATLVGPVWIGARRRIDTGCLVPGPAILWDAPEPAGTPLPDLFDARFAIPNDASASRPPLGKRCFDVVFALVALAVTLPLYPLIMLAIWIEDGRPFFFAHTRETCGPRNFACLKFRSMRKNADRIKAQLVGRNRADGPQFFIEDDPRLTRIGRFLRRTNIDELPQFWNVLLGHMSVVGPRPSPREENQFCPPWREARLSVRPGIAGLWQVCRTRAPGLDFQEWIRFDVEYVRRQSWRLDLWIIWRAVLLLLLQRKPDPQGFDHE